MKIAFLFPGQGAQYVGMGKDLYENYEEAKNIYDNVEKILNLEVKKISFEGPAEVLNQTKNTQIAILTHSLAILEILKKHDINSEILSGLSLGEYTALIYAGIISFEDGIKIVRRRGELMQENVPEGTWKMAAILGLEDEKVEEVCKKVKSGFVVPANYNCPGQVAISGEEKAVKEAMEIAKEEGARKAIELQTSGPFHTVKLEKAAEKLKIELDKININTDFTKQIIRNIDSEIYKKDDDMREILSKHVMSPVKFKNGIEKMIENGVDTFIEIGPRKSIIRICKKSK